MIIIIIAHIIVETVQFNYFRDTTQFCFLLHENSKFWPKFSLKTFNDLML